jgi:hypothetical protein
VAGSLAGLKGNDMPRYDIDEEYTEQTLSKGLSPKLENGNMPISAWIDQIHAQNNVLGKSLDTLCGRLTPVIGPFPLSPNAKPVGDGFDQVEDPGESPLSHSLQQILHELRLVTEQITGAISRLEL